jgi:hypothetical protein
VAREHGALAWELRAATSLARLWRGGPRAAQGLDRLARVLAQMAPSAGEADQQAARQLLDRAG